VAIKSLDLERCSSNLVTYSDPLFVQSVFALKQASSFLSKIWPWSKASSLYEKGITDPRDGYGYMMLEHDIILQSPQINFVTFLLLFS
jgi:hypothetical protein